MARRVDLTKGWNLAGYKDFSAALSDGEKDVDGIPCAFPACAEEILAENQIIPDYRFGKNERQIEWTQHRFWVFKKIFTLRPEPEDAAGEKYFLYVTELFGRGEIHVNGRLAAKFSPEQSDIFADVTAVILEKDENSVKIIFFPERHFSEEGGDISAVSCRGVGGEICLKSVSYARISALECLLDGAGNLRAKLRIDAANRGKYVLKYRARNGNELSGSINAAEQLIAARQEKAHAFSLEQGKTADTVRLTLERGGIRCDYADAPVFRELPAPELLRAVSWRPLSPYICGVSAEKYGDAIALLMCMGANAVYLKKDVREKSLFFRICNRMGMPVLREGADRLPDNAVEIGAEEPDLIGKIFSLRLSGRPMLISDMVSWHEDADGGALFTSAMGVGMNFGHVSEALCEKAVWLRRRGEDSFEIIHFGEASGEVLLFEFGLLGAQGSRIYSQVFHVPQKSGVTSSGVFSAYGVSGVAADAVIYSGKGMIASSRIMLGGENGCAKPSVERVGGGWKIANNSPEFVENAFILESGGKKEPYCGILFPWESKEIAAG